jgi:DNA (cytosine-5)-methyltransferase 1
MARTFPIVDLFAGPGGLGEGFSAFRDARGRHPFRIAVSVEKEASAFETLRLRSFLRQFPRRFPKEYHDFLNLKLEEPDWKKLYPKQWRAACKEVMKLELGTPGSRKILRPRIAGIRAKASSNAILIGGPPCQAYSRVGRSRNLGVKGYEARDDHRHYLYREYIEVIHRLQPAVFVMENVEGMISSSIDGKKIFSRVLRDLRKAGGKKGSYTLFSLSRNSRGKINIVPPADSRSYLVRSEEFGVPQTRHRVIIIGVRSDVAKSHPTVASTPPPSDIAVEFETSRNVLQGLPKLRSGLSRNDSDQSWSDAVETGLTRIARLASSSPKYNDVSRRARLLLKRFRKKSTLRRSSSRKPGIGSRASSKLKKWIVDSRLRSTPNHFTRQHMKSDLARYLFASIFAQVRGRSPKQRDFPRTLSPAHGNWKSGDFDDRFRVQVYSRPSNTITSHISKDGHYFIHPDPLQCRSLTVREAARLQTFPDNYFFKGNRTEQYVQVGNAVPPFLALQIASAVHELINRHDRYKR